MFSDAFYKCTYELLLLAISQAAQGDIVEDQSKFELIYKIVDRVMFDLLVNSRSISELKSMTDLLVVLLSKSDEAVVHLIKNRVFAPKESLGKDEKNFFEMLASHPEQEVREMASTTLCFALSRLLQIGGEECRTYIDETITQVLDLMP